MANSNFSDSQREEIWRKYFGESLTGIDAFGRLVSKENFECDHIFPRAKGGKTIIENGIPLAPISNEQKANNLSGFINGKSFKVEGGTSDAVLYVNTIKKSK